MTPEEMGFALVCRERDALAPDEIEANGGNPLGYETAWYRLPELPSILLRLRLDESQKYPNGWWSVRDVSRRNVNWGVHSDPRPAVIEYADRLRVWADGTEKDCAKAQEIIERRVSDGRPVTRAALFSAGLFSLDCAALILYGPDGAAAIVQRMRDDAAILRAATAGKKAAQGSLFGGLA